MPFFRHVLRLCMTDYTTVWFLLVPIVGRKQKVPTFRKTTIFFKNGNLLHQSKGLKSVWGVGQFQANQ